MADSFLHLVVKDILNRTKGDLGKCVVIFPNQRPGLYFKKELELTGYKGKYPIVYSIENFIDEHAGSKSMNAIDLILLLFRLYLKHYPESDFESFYGWGTMMLSDYDEIDRYMADPKRLFKNLSAVKDLEKYFLQDESTPFEMLPDLRPEDEQYLKKRFLENWEVYEKVYFDFKSELLSSNLAYTGMNFRKVAEGIESGIIKTDAEKYIFIGFNAISKSEEVIIQKLIDQNKALIYWDGDRYFIDNEREGSGYFIRKSLHRLHGYNNQLFGDQILTGSKDIHIIGAPLRVGQTKVFGTELKKHAEKFMSDSTCVVLLDDDLIVPVLYSISDLEIPVNLSSGYPLRFSVINSLFQNISTLIGNYRKDTQSFYHKDVISVLSHPLIRSQNDNGVSLLLNKIQKEQLIYITQNEVNEVLFLDNSSILKLFFRQLQTIDDLHNYFHEILINIRNYSDLESIENETFNNILDELKLLIRSNENLITWKMYLRLLKEKIKFSIVGKDDQNLDALQITGMLETRCLDFETVFMLPVNEGIMPETTKNRSYIPYDIRRNFGLPMREEQENIYAYNFYRLLQKAKNIYLVFDSETTSGGDEESRYIKQVEYYLPKANPNIKIHRRFYGLPFKNKIHKEIIIQKGQPFYEMFSAKIETGISPTFISSYFVCPLQFYFKNVLNIPEDESIVEELEAKHLGTLYHNVMDQVYDSLKGVQVDQENLNTKKAALAFTLDKVLSKIYSRQKDNIISKNHILIETVKILAEKTLEADMKYAPFKIIDTEVYSSCEIPYAADGFEILKFKGIIDRIDEKDGVSRIVDYKTGRVKTYNFNYNDPEETLHKDNKEAFQTLFYGMLFLKNNPGAKLRPSILPLREVTKGYINVNEKDGLFGQKESQLFEDKLNTIIHAILDPEIPFSQTEDLMICKNCSYKNICMR